MTELLIGVLLQGLKLWTSKESTKYVDRVLKLQSGYVEEYNKPRAERNNAKLDEIQEELEMISKVFITTGGLKLKDQ